MVRGGNRATTNRLDITKECDMNETSIHSHATRANCYNCGKTVYGESEANAGGHVFCCRNCRNAWERDEARRHARESAAKRREEKARRIREANAKIDAENALRWQEQQRLNREAEARDRKICGWAWLVAVLLVLLAISREAAAIAVVAVVLWLARRWIWGRLCTLAGLVGRLFNAA